jgi:YceI-like domain
MRALQILISLAALATTPFAWGSDWTMSIKSKGKITLKILGVDQSADFASEETKPAIQGKAVLDSQSSIAIEDCDANIDATLVKSSTSAFLDGIIQGPGILDSKKHPNLTFRCKKFLPGDEENHFQVEGDLTIKTIKKSRTLDGEFKPKFPTDNDDKVTLILTTVITRQDFEIELADLRDNALGNSVTIKLEIELKRMK